MKNLWKSNEHPSKNIKKVHMIGAGGCGMQSLKTWLEAKDYIISCSDDYKHQDYMIQTSENPSTDCDCIIVSSVIPKDHPQYIWALKNNKPVFHRASFVKYLLTEDSIAVSGTHGKTTTSGLISWILYCANLNPSFILGDKIRNLDSSSQYCGNISVVESDESDGSMQKLTGKTNIITNIDEDHMDYFKTQENLINSFNNFANQSEKCIINIDSEKFITHTKCITYSSNNENANLYANNIRIHQNGSCFDIKGLYNFKDIYLNIPGEYNIDNSLAAILASMQYNVHEADLRHALSSFKGMNKRMEIHQNNGVNFILDYSHHQNSLKLLLNTVNKQKYNNVYVIIEIHKYSRLRNGFSKFLEHLSTMNHVAILPIFKAGEDEDENLELDFHKKLSKQTNLTLVNSFECIQNFINKNKKTGDAFLFIGAGNICKFYYDTVKLFKN